MFQNKNKMEECRFNIKILGHFIRLTKNNKFIILGKRQGQWIEVFKT